MILQDKMYIQLYVCLYSEADDCVYGLWDVQLAKKLHSTCNHNNFVKENLHSVPHTLMTNYLLFLLAVAWNSCNYTHSPVCKKHPSTSRLPLHLKECS